MTLLAMLPNLRTSNLKGLGATLTIYLLSGKIFILPGKTDPHF